MPRPHNDIRYIQSCHTHPARIQQINGKLVTQAVYLLYSQACIAEHTALFDEIAEIAIGDLAVKTS